MMTSYYAVDVDNIGAFGVNAPVAALRSAITAGISQNFLLNTGGANSDFGGGQLQDCGQITQPTDLVGRTLGAGADFQDGWAASNFYFWQFNGLSDQLRFSNPSADRYLFDTSGGNTVSEYNFNALKVSFGAQSGAVGNQKFPFVSGAETITVAGDYSGMLWTYAANDTLNAAIGTYATATWNAGTPTIGTGSLTNNTVMLIGGNPGAASNDRTALRIISNPTGGAGVNAALYVTAGLSRFDGRVDINNGIALGGGAGATLGAIGGSGPTAAAQAQWVEIDIGGVAHWIPVWT